jgi:hypothetical protein
MDDQDVTVRPASDRLADALAEQPLEHVRLVRPDDDQIRLALVGEFPDRVRRLADWGHVPKLDQAVETPGIQFVPARGTRAIAAASTVSATRSSGSRLCTWDLPQARASV